MSFWFNCSCFNNQTNMDKATNELNGLFSSSFFFFCTSLRVQGVDKHVQTFAIPLFNQAGVAPLCSQQGRKEMFYLTTHSTHFIYGYMASDIWLRTTQIVRGNLLLPHKLLFPISSKGVTKAVVCAILSVR